MAAIRPLVALVLTGSFLSGLLPYRATAADANTNESGIPTVLVATAIAYSDFEHRLAEKKGTSEMGDFFSRIENYEITITDNGATCIVHFSPRPFRGNLTRGGSASYVVEVATRKILEMHRYR